jgi:hypothetical protein
MTGKNFKKFLDRYLEPQTDIMIASRICDDVWNYFNVFVRFYYDEKYYLREKRRDKTTFKQYWKWRQQAQSLKIS